MTIILPEGTVEAWQAAHAAGTTESWCNVDKALLLYADIECDLNVRRDILTLADVAWAHAMDAGTPTAPSAVGA